jgi:hypothetical protein
MDEIVNLYYGSSINRDAASLGELILLPIDNFFQQEMFGNHLPRD